MNEKNEMANCLNEEPLITADQVTVGNYHSIQLIFIYIAFYHRAALRHLS